MVKKATPIMFVEAIEPVLPFWTALGFEATVTVPEGDKLGFAILARDGIEIMYQSRASVRNDIPALAVEPFVSRTNLFVEVESLEAIKPLVAGAPVVVPERTTFYGARELGVRAPCGTVVIFAEMKG